MSGMKKSKLLEWVLLRASSLAEEQGGKVTVDCLMASLIICITDSGIRKEVAGSDADVANELLRTDNLLKAQPCEPLAAKEQLISSMRQSASDAFMGNLMMQKILCDAEARAKKNELPHITADLILQCMLDQPTRAILQHVLQKPTPTAGQAGGSAGQPDTVTPVPGIPKPRQVKRAPEAAPEAETPAAETAYTKDDVSELISRTKKIQGVLLDSVFGQENAVQTFITGYFQSELLAMTDKSRVRPRATFLFAGPPGVGKTFLAEKVAESLQLPFLRLDMSEYSDHEANQVLTGFDPVYKGAKAGLLTEFVANNPQCILLFDEVEKAHLNVIHLFLQMLDAGRLQDVYTKKMVPFKDTIIIMTTNAGRKLYEESDSVNLSGYSKKVILRALERDINPQTRAPFFPAAICSRFASGNVVMFNHMEAHFLRKIARKEILRHAENLRKEVGIESTFDEAVFTTMLFSEGGSADARTIRGRAETFFDNELFELFRLVDNDKRQTSLKDIEQIRFAVRIPDDPEISVLFETTEKPRVLLFADGETAAAFRSECCQILHADTIERACHLIEEEDVKMVLCDVRHGIRQQDVRCLNAEDVDSLGRDFLQRTLANYNLPVYLLQRDSYIFSEEEKLSFLREGVRDLFPLTGTMAEIDEVLSDICENIHQQQSMLRLSQSNRLITFETAQTLSADGKQATVELFDLRLAVAVDAGDAKNMLSNMSKPNIRFDDVIGSADAKEELRYFVQYLKNPKKFRSTGVQAPKGVLLYGPPGTGKTMLAKAMAGESDVTFITAEGNQFLKKYVGEGPEAVHELFRTARKYAPTILFIDEIDAIAKERRGGDGSAGREEVLTAFLTEMDGFNKDPNKPVFVLAATNFDIEPGKAKSLDPALMRRFDRRVFIDLPTKDERAQYLQMRMKAMPALAMSQGELDNIVMRSTGMSLAELASVIEMALRSAIRTGDGKVTDEIFDEAFETFNSGETKQWDASLLERVARHEAGHAFLYWQSGETPSYLTIVARGDHGGYMQHADTEGKAIHSKQEILDKIRTSLGGRAAEIVYYGQEGGLSSGASGDLESATRRALYLLCIYGMDSEFGLASIDPKQVNLGDADSPARKAINAMLQAEMDKAIRILTENRHKLDALVARLMEQNHMSGAEIDALLKDA